MHLVPEWKVLEAPIESNTITSCCLHCMYCILVLYNSYIPQTEQHEPKGWILFCLGNVTNLLDVTPRNPMPHPLPSPPILLHVIKDLVAKQHPTNIITWYGSIIVATHCICTACVYLISYRSWIGYEFVKWEVTYWDGRVQKCYFTFHFMYVTYVMMSHFMERSGTPAIAQYFCNIYIVEDTCNIVVGSYM